MRADLRRAGWWRADAMQCPSCGFANRDGAVFCAGCGGSFAAGVAGMTAEPPTVIQQRAEPPTGTLVPCPTCGSAMSSETRRCFACGHGTTGQREVARRPMMAIVSGVAAVVAVIASLGALYLWRSGGSSTDTIDSGRPVTLIDEGSTDAAIVVLSSAPEAEPAAEPDAAAVSTVPVTTAPPLPAAATVAPTPTLTTLPPSTSTMAPVPPPTAAAPPPPPPTTVPGDLSIAGYTMVRPECDGSYIVSVGSFPPDVPGDIRATLERFPGTNYLRTDETCLSLRWYFPEGAGTWAGKPIYMVVFGPYTSLADACEQQTVARIGQPDAYSKVLNSDLNAVTVNPCG